jgi:hypothetical protein
MLFANAIWLEQTPIQHDVQQELSFIRLHVKFLSSTMLLSACLSSLNDSNAGGSA